MNLKRTILFINFTILSLFFISCSSNIPTPNERKQTAINLSSSNKNIVQKDIQTSQFNLFSLQDIKMSCSNIKIFVEKRVLFYYEKSKVYSKETRKAGRI